MTTTDSEKPSDDDLPTMRSLMGMFKDHPIDLNGGAVFSDRLTELAKQLPEGLRSDWIGTNHFELTTSTDEYWWLTLSEIHGERIEAESELGRRLGLLMDIAAEVRKIIDQK